MDVDVPLWRVVGVTGLSGSGKSSLAMGVLYAEGSRRFLDGLSTFTRRRIEQAAKPDVDRVDYLPAALALRQRPPVPGRRSTVGTMSEVLSVVRLMVSRLGAHVCPNGHRNPPSLAAAADEWTDCVECGIRFRLPGAESFAFNSLGACPVCHGMGTRDEVDEDSLVPDPSKSLAEGAVLPWNSAGRSYMPRVAAELGVRIDVPYAELTAAEKDVVLHGPPEQREVTLPSKKGRAFKLNMTFENAVAAVTQAGSSDSETTRSRLSRFFTTHVCPACHGTRYRPEALASHLDGRTIAEITALDLEALDGFARELPGCLPEPVRALAGRLAGELRDAVGPLRRLGLDYLSLDRAGDSLSTGERQRVQLARTVRERSTGLLYVLDEPSVGLHPANVAGVRDLVGVLADNGNSVVVVDHDVALLRAADHLIEMGPGAGSLGGTVTAQGTPQEVAADPASVTGPFLSGEADPVVRERRSDDDDGRLSLTVGELYNLRDVTVRVPLRRLTLVTGVSGSGKTALVLDSLVPALRRTLDGLRPPAHVTALDAGGLTRLVQIDATPIGKNARSTPATYSGVFDPVRQLFAAAPEAGGWKPGHFSYNTRDGQCHRCEGLGELSLDIQYLPDLTIRCPDCDGGRYNPQTLKVRVDGRTIADVLALTVDEAAEAFAERPAIAGRLAALRSVGLGYLTLGEPTPSLSGGEAQRLRLAEALRTDQADTLFVFDEPSIGLHPRDVRTLLRALDGLLAAGATVLVIDHDLDLIANADHVVDLGPGAGPHGGRVVAQGSPDAVAADPGSPTGVFLAAHLGRG
ncbi:excinuclease ABC subunit UvrA [Actinocorallia sp. A-T 12471]|uniref:excinuclease ABC subunit UvrA n=1 Tax=Actinocorallia sp. A-T 12471 TaxID=3089813 RepID=UPI0029CBCCB4|nr:excinuclease ABC subunit UvrA [Actinocorallia sp. A-T 12471]MDX6741974.1 excinuclease ABC subunit UvrA [Actinocorallia sp. A-T 12471]